MTGLRIASLCAGYAGLDLAVHSVLGGELAWLADNDPGAAAILAHRFPSVPNLGDITKADWSEIEPVDVLTAGFPCQDVSCAGARRGLREGTRTGVWSHVARAIAELRPSLVVLENVRGLLSAGADSDLEFCPWCLGESGAEHALRACGAVLGDLADLLYDTAGTVVSAADAGAPHRRERVFILAWPAADADDDQLHQPAGADGAADERPPARRSVVWPRGRATEDPDRPASGEWRQSAPGQAEGGRPRADAGGSGGARTDDDGAPEFVEWCPEMPGRWHNSWGYCTSQPAPGDAPPYDGPITDPDDAATWSPAADADLPGWQGAEPARRHLMPARGAPADAQGDRRNEGRPESARLVRGPDAAVGSDGTPADAERGGRDRRSPEPIGEPGRRTATAGSGEGDRGRPTPANADRPHPGPQSGGSGKEAPAGQGDGQERGREPGPGVSGGTPADTDGGGRGANEHEDAAGQPDLDWGAYGPAIARWEAVTGRSAPAPTEPGRTGQRLSPRFVEFLMGLPEGWVTDVPGLSRNAQLKALGNGVVPQQAAMALRMLLDRAGIDQGREAA